MFCLFDFFFCFFSVGDLTVHNWPTLLDSKQSYKVKKKVVAVKEAAAAAAVKKTAAPAVAVAVAVASGCDCCLL